MGVAQAQEGVTSGYTYLRCVDVTVGVCLIDRGTEGAVIQLLHETLVHPV